MTGQETIGAGVPRLEPSTVAMAMPSDAQHEALILPWESVKSRWTKQDYFRDSRWFLEFAGYADPKKIHHTRGPDYLANQTRAETTNGMYKLIQASVNDPTKAKVDVLRFIRMLNEKVAKGELGPAEVRRRLTPIKLALEMNEVAIPWKKMMRLLPAEKRSKDREYKFEEIQKLLAVASLHLQVAILFMASSGMRVGAFEFLNVGHVKPVMIKGNLACAQVTVYADEGDDEYETLISKEAFLKFQEYLGTRRAKGEKVTEESPLIVTRRWAVGKQTRYSVTGIRNDVTRLCWKAGLRQKGSAKRFEVQACHGLRKFFDNVSKDHIAEEYVEKLIGHSTGTKEHYDRHIPKPAIEQYLRAMPYLSIGEAYRSEAQLSQKLEKIEDEQDVKLRDTRIELLETKQRLTDMERSSQTEREERRANDEALNLPS